MTTQFSRRALIGSSAFWFSAFTEIVYSQTEFQPEPVTIAPDIEIRDYRLFPTDDITRFIVEVVNTGDSIVDAPTLGVRMPTLGESFGIAAPAQSVIFPHSSVALFGVAPEGVHADADWANAEWVLCHEIQHRRADEAARINVSLEYETEIISDVNLAVNFVIENQRSHNSPPFELGGGVFDEGGRVCGVVLPWYFRPLLPNQSYANRVNVARGMSYYASPFTLVDDVHGLHVDLNVLPPHEVQNYSCPAVLPWNW